MIALIDDNRDAIDALCQQYGVQRSPGFCERFSTNGIACSTTS